MKRLSLWAVCILTTLVPYSAWEAVESVVWAAGTVRYVDPMASCTGNYSIASRNCTGSNGNSYATINAAAAATASGDIIYVRGGTYAETLLNALPSGSLSFPTTLSSYNNELVIVRPGSTSLKVFESASRANLVLYGITWDGQNATSDVIKLTTGSNNVTISGPAPTPGGVYLCRVINGGTNGISVQGAMDAVTIRNCEIADNALPDNVEPISHGLYIQNVSNFLMEGSLVHGNACLGIAIYPSTQGAVLRDNEFYGNGVHANCSTEVNLANSGHLFERNIVRTTGTGGYGIRMQYGTGGTPSNMTIRHNTVYGSFLHCIYVDTAGSNNVLQNNILLGCTNPITNLGTNTTDTDNLKTGTATNIFTNPSGGNLTLKAGSVAIDGGTAIGGTANGTPDQGAHEVPTFSACTVEASATSVVRVAFTNNLRPPMLPASSVTGVTFRKNGASNAVVSSTKISDNVYGFTVTNSYAGGDTVDISINPATTNLTDSALIGNTTNQPFVSTLTNTACTNNAAGAPSHTYTQARYELHDWRGLEASPVILPHGFASTGAAENFANYKVPPGGKIRVRFAVVCGGADCPSTSFHPYFSTGGAYAVITDDFSSNNMKMCGLSSGTDMPINASATTDQLSTGGIFIPGGIVFTSHDVPEIIGLNTGYKTEVEYCVALDTDATGTFDMRLYLSDGTALNTYTVTPRLVMEPMAAGGM